MNIIVLAIVVIVDIINSIFALILGPSIWNIYNIIDHQLFVNLRNMNVWTCRINNWEEIPGNKQFKNRSDVLRRYFTGFWCDKE